jgi:predicted transcriptional regulator
MNISVRLPEAVEKQLSAYCQAHRISRSEAVKQALDSFLSAQTGQPTAYELGKEGFGADRTHTGDIARNSKRLLRKKFRGQADR